MNKIKSLHIFALAAHGTGLSGGDRIFIELARRWHKMFPINIYVWEEGYQMLLRQHLKITDYRLQITNKKKKRDSLNVYVSKLGKFCGLGFVFCYLARVFEGLKFGLSLDLENKDTICIYNASEFWMDSIPCVLLKLRFPKIKWIASWYQTAPSPFKGFAEGNGARYRFSALFYWLAQLPVKPLVSKYADKVIVNNEDEKKQFPDHTNRGDTIVLIGAVPLKDIENWKQKNRNFPKVYDAIFQGRFHPQKGIVELIDIWKKVVNKIPAAKLAMIGDGPLMKNVKLRIKNLKLENNIKLFGYVFDGPEKYKIFAQSKLVVHPAFYDSGGMAAAEAMTFGLPAVGFNLKAFDSYYPKGMVKVEFGNLDAFAKAIVKLIKNVEYRNNWGQEAKEMIGKNWSWDKRAQEVYTKVML